MNPRYQTAGNRDLAPPLPHDREAERVVLGSIILDNVWMKTAMDTLRSQDFFIPQHRAIFTEMVDLASQSEEISTPALVVSLSKGNRLELAGGTGYLAALADDVHHLPKIDGYLARIVQTARLRNIAYQAQKLQDECLKGIDPTFTVEEIHSLVAPQQQVGVLEFPDLPEAALDGRLGEICQRRLQGLPRSYAWCALVAAAGVLVPRSGIARTNLFSCLVGPVGSGKSQGVDRSVAVMGIVEPALQAMMSGSAEGMLEKLANSNGEARLFSPDELGHLLTKAKIDNSSYSYVLNTAYYKEKFDVTMARGRQASFNCSLSILGGLVEDKFEDLFGSATTGGLYDRFVFGMCPQPFDYHYRPLEGSAEQLEPCGVIIHPSAYEALSEWVKAIPGLSKRCAEHALRVATIAAAFDGRSILYAKDLGSAREFAAYQARIRKKLQPNPGENAVAKCANAIITSLGDSTDWVPVRTMARKIHADRFGPSVYDQTLRSLEGIGEIIVDKRRPARVRRTLA